MKQFYAAVSLLCVLMLSGCASRINMKAHELGPPKRIGVVIGHDIRAFIEITSGEVMLYGALGEVIGASIPPEDAYEWKMTFENDIMSELWEDIQKEMQGKNYDVHLYKTKPKEWSLFENTSGGREVYFNLVNYYQLDARVKMFDAILFVEVLIEGRLMGIQNIEELKAANMKVEYSKSKVFLFHTASGKRIAHDLIQKEYPSSSTPILSESIVTLDTIEPLPAESGR